MDLPVSVVVLVLGSGSRQATSLQKVDHLMADTSHSAAHDHGHAGEHQHHGGLAKYIAVFVALCVLTGISFAVGNSQSLRENSPHVMWAAMMAVSCAKAMLVILFFMHLIWEANWKYVLTIPASLMSIFLMLMLVPDIGRRTQKYSDERWLYAAEPQAPHAHGESHAQPATDGHTPAEGHSDKPHGHSSAEPHTAGGKH
jgi:cytochrome c oxidase subunit 4